MKIFRVFLLQMFLFVMVTSVVFAQEHYTEGNVREVNYFRTNPGQFDVYMEYLRENFLPQQEELKKAGFILDYSILLNQPSNASDWDVAVTYVYKNFAALDYNQAEDDKVKEIQSKHYKTQDEDKIAELAAKRFEMRTYIGKKYLREVVLKPMNK